MAEYIEKEKLLTDINNGIKAGNYEEGYEQYQNINNMDDIIETIKYSDSADVVERAEYDFIVKNRDYYKDKYKHFLQLYDTCRHKNITLKNKIDKAIEEMGKEVYEAEDFLGIRKDVIAFDDVLEILKRNIGE